MWEQIHLKFLGPERVLKTSPSSLAVRVPIGIAWVKRLVSQHHFVERDSLPAGFAVSPKMLLQLNLLHVSFHYVFFMINVSKSFHFFQAQIQFPR